MVFLLVGRIDVTLWIDAVRQKRPPGQEPLEGLVNKKAARGERLFFGSVLTSGHLKEFDPQLTVVYRGFFSF